MQFKIDTKEKFTVLTPLEGVLYDNMAAEIAADLEKYLLLPGSNIILNLKNISEIETEAAAVIAELQQKFYEETHSFVICEINDKIEAQFEKLDLLDYLNITPSESEAWDIVQMEEIERELLDNGDEITFNAE
jgi:anti-anti-sigma regulatory factor